MDKRNRWDELRLLRKHYPTFDIFLYDVMTGLLGFTCSDIQLDIAEYLATGPQYRMIQAQRGQAKTTIAAAYVIWASIHNPSLRTLIVSAGGAMAKEISSWIIQIVMGMEDLECMRPDRSAGDKASVEAFDFHYELKGPEKSPSIACMGITSNMQGKRADLLIADDVESAKNSQTEHQRERLKHLTKDFSSICSAGDIVYLGTPQSIDSVYNGLYSRGYDIRIWPGRYPTLEEQENYGDFLAPFIKDQSENDPSLRSGGGATGLRGKIVDRVLPGLSEDKLTKKELDQGAAYFQLQHMLDTRLMDADRFPLNAKNFVFMQIAHNSAPLEINVQRGEQTRISTPVDFPIEEKYYRAAGFGQDFAPFTGTHMYVDPAGGGQNGDETAYAVTRFCAGRVFLTAIGGVKGGLNEDSLDELTDIAVKHKPNQIDIEKNFGNGALSQIWQPKLLQRHKCHIEDVWESGQKELRIIDTLEPVVGSSRLVIDEDLLYEDWLTCQKYPIEKRASYSLFYQLARITRDRDSLTHDDRLDALAGTVRFWVPQLATDAMKVVEQSRRNLYRDMMQNPLGNGRPLPGYKGMHGLTTTTCVTRMHRRV